MKITIIHLPGLNDQIVFNDSEMVIEVPKGTAEDLVELVYPNINVEIINGD